MRILFVLVLFIFTLANSQFAQSGKVKNYSESNPESHTEPLSTSPADQLQIDKSLSENNSNSDVIRVETTLVVIPTKVSTRSRKTVLGLQPKDFTVFENGIPQEIAFFSDQEQPVTVALLLDTSYSTILKLSDIQKAALNFISKLRADDRVMVVAFSEKVEILCPPTNDRRILRLAIAGTQVKSGTSLYDAFDQTLSELARLSGRRSAIVVLTDGVDSTSKNSTREQILKTINESDVIFYPFKYETFYDVQKLNEPVIVEGQVVAGYPRMTKGARSSDYESADEFLDEVSNQTGGHIYRVTDRDDLSSAFADLSRELGKIYSLGYYPAQDRVDSQKYVINVRVARPNLIVRARDSYLFQPKNRTESVKR